MTRKILITGGQGFVGRALVNRFADLGFEVTCADMRDTPIRNDVTCLQVDIRNPGAIAEPCAAMDSVIHNDSLVHTKHNRESDIWAVNHGGAENVLADCKQHGISSQVYISTASAVYEGKDIENGDETLPYSRISQAP